MSIHLTSKEKQLCDLLLDVVKKNKLTTTLRIAGGWVRDKLLGFNSMDIDITLDNIMGKDFAKLVNDYLREHHLPTHHIGIISKNPEQSKHLETATVHILDFWIDFVNLRSELYSQESRIPSKIVFGTPLEDSLRRDITINALFYNLHQNCVEDFTGKGLKDLHEGIIRTPLKPFQTFIDDPLRILRVIRFSGRFDYHIEPDALVAIHAEPILIAFQNKISKERIGIEILKMVEDTYPLRSLNLLIETPLFPIIFLKCLSKDQLQEIKHLQYQTLHLMTKIDTLLHSEESQMKFELNSISSTHKICCYMATLLTPLIGYLRSRNPNEFDLVTLKEDLPFLIIRDDLKWPSKEAFIIQSIIKGTFHLQLFLSQHPILQNISRKQIGTLIKQLGSTWKLSSIIAYALESMNVDETEPSLKYSQFIHYVHELHLDQAYDIKPLLNGHQIKTCLNLTHNGPLIGFYIEKVIEWQFEHVQGTEEECLLWLKQEHDKKNFSSETRSLPSSPIIRKKSKVTNQ
jgi:tRNA nucleotidyltransferase (CCA-adding enzyme)